VLANLDGTSTTELGLNVGPTFTSPDGNWLAFESDTNGWGRQRAAAGGPAQRPNPVVHPRLATGFDGRFTPDGRRFVYVSGGAFSVPIDGGARVALGSADSLVMSADGRLVLVRPSYDRPLEVVPVEGGPARIIPTGVGAASHSLHQFSPDGRYVFPAAFPATAVSTETGVPRELSTDLDVAVVSYATLTRTVWFTSRSMSGEFVSRLALEETDEPTRLTDRLAELVVSPGRRCLAFSVRPPADGSSAALTVVNLQTGASRSFSPGTGRPVFAPDEARFVYTDGAGHVRIGNCDDGSSVTIADAKQPFLQGPGFSPDGSRVMFADGSLAIVAATDGSAVTPFARQIGVAISWRSNRQLFFSIAGHEGRPAFVEGSYVAPVP
jgi:hypothetical protein